MMTNNTQNPPMSEQEIVCETVVVFENNPRSLSTCRQYCRYHGENKARCAFSRCCDPNIDLSRYESNACDMILQRKGQDILQPQYRGHSERFWVRLQVLHDMHGYWTKNGKLSKTGREYIQKYFGFDIQTSFTYLQERIKYTLQEAEQMAYKRGQTDALLAILRKVQEHPDLQHSKVIHGILDIVDEIQGKSRHDK